MNIWDSVHRGLEKATQEASRIAKIQRLRATLDSLSKQIETQQGAITIKTMELFKSGQLTQNELLVLCQEISNAQQQFTQVQNELKQVQQSQSNQNPATGPQTATVAYTQPTYLPYDSSQPSLVPPPPPGIEPLTVSSQETIRAEVPPPPAGNELKHCVSCRAVLIPGNAFCHNCGTPAHTDASYQPTVRANNESIVDPRYADKTVRDGEIQPPVRANYDETSDPRYADKTVRDNVGQPTVRANDDESSVQEKNGGV